MSWKTKGIEDGRLGKQYTEPKKDLLDYVGVGYSEKQLEQNKRDYEEGYKIGTLQRVADSNKNKRELS